MTHYTSRHRRPQPLAPAVISAGATSATAALTWAALWPPAIAAAVIALLFAAETGHELLATRTLVPRAPANARAERRRTHARETPHLPASTNGHRPPTGDHPPCSSPHSPTTSTASPPA